MRAVVRSEVDVAAPARRVWDYVTDWPRQGEWIPMTRVERVSGPLEGRSGERVGERIRAWTGIGPAGFWDTMTVTAWHEDEDGSAGCEVLHTGRVVRGEGELAVVARSPEFSTFVWWERLDVPGGRLGALTWPIAGRVMRRGVDHALARLARRVVELDGRGR